MLAPPSAEVTCAASIHNFSDDVVFGRREGWPTAVISCVPPVDFLRSDVVNALMAESTPRERAYRLRCHPSARQRRALGWLLGASRFVWNWALARRTSAYQAGPTRLNGVSLSREFTGLCQAPKTHGPAELPREPFNQVLRDQERALQNFCARRARTPRFRRRGGHERVHFTLDQRRAQVERDATPRWAWVDLPGLGRVTLRRQVRSKAAWAGRPVIEIDQCYPSSQRGCECGTVNAPRGRAKRWECPACGVSHDRAENAVKNSRAEGMRQLAASSSPPTGQGPGSDARGVACAAERARRVTAGRARRRPPQNRELAQRPVRAKTARALSGTAR